MAKKSTAQVQFEADTSGFTAGIREADRSLATLRNELKLNSSELKENGDAVDLLAQRQDILQREKEESAKKVENLSQKLEAAKQTFGDSSQEVYNLNNQLLRAQNQYQVIQNDITNTSKRMDELTNVTRETGDSAEESGDGFTIMKGAMADLVADGIQSLIGGIGDLVGSLFDLVEATEEYRVMQAKLEGSAGTFGYNIGFAKDQYEEFYRYLGDDQMATNAITNLMGLGTSTQNVSDLANAATAVWSAYGDSIPIEGLTEAMNETAQVGEVTGSLADALNWAGISEDDFNTKLESCNGTQERAQLIADTLNAKYGDSKKRFDELSESTLDANEAQLELKDSQAGLADAVAPVQTAFTNLKTKALDMLSPAIEAIAEPAADILDWANETPGAMEGLAGVVATLAGAFGILAGALAIQGIITGVSKAMTILNGTLLANPIVLVVATITGLVVGFVTLWNTSEGFRNFWIGLWDTIKSAASGAWDAIKSTVSTAVNAVKSVISTVFNAIKNAVITPVMNAIKSVVSTVWNAIKSVITTVVNTIKSTINNVWNSIKSITSSVFNSVKNTASNVWNSIKSTISGVVNKVKSTVSNVWNGIKSTTSSVFNSVKNTASNVWNRIKDAITKPINSAKDAVKSAINKIKGFFNFSWSLPKLKLPHFSVSGKFSLNPPSVPKFSIQWYKDGGILTAPTMFGFNPRTGTAHVGGEAGAEAVLPIERLETWINRTLRQSNAEIASYTNEKMEKLITVVEKILAKDSNIYMNDRKVSESLGGSNDIVNGERRQLLERGLAL